MIHDLEPYPAYKDSGVPWLREIPAHWEVRRNGRLFAQRNETGFADLPILEVSLKTGVRVRNFDESARKQQMSDRDKYKRACRGDIAYNMMRMWQGAVGVAAVDGLVSPAYVVARSLPGTEPLYFELLFRTGAYMREVNNYSRGIVSDRNRLYWDDFKQIASPFPPPAEQSAIVRFLDHANRRIQRYIRAKKKLIALLNEQKQAIIHQAVTRGLDPNVRLKPSGVEWLGEVPEGWVVLRIKDCSRLISKGTTPSTEGREILETGPVRFLKGENIVGGKIAEEPRSFIDEETDDLLRRSRLEEGDVLFVIAGTLGKSTVVEREVLPANTNQAVAFVRPNTKVMPRYLALWLQSPRVQELTWLNAVRSAQPNLSMADLGNFLILVPPLAEQKITLKNLADLLARPTIAAERAQREIDILQEYRTRLIADVVTGKLDVREAVARLPEEFEVPDPIDEGDALAEEDEEGEGAEGEDSSEEAVA